MKKYIVFGVLLSVMNLSCMESDPYSSTSEEAQIQERYALVRDRAVSSTINAVLNIGGLFTNLAIGSVAAAYDSRGVEFFPALAIAPLTILHLHTIYRNYQLAPYGQLSPEAYFARGTHGGVAGINLALTIGGILYDAPAFAAVTGLNMLVSVANYVKLSDDIDDVANNERRPLVETN